MCFQQKYHETSIPPSHKIARLFLAHDQSLFFYPGASGFLKSWSAVAAIGSITIYFLGYLSLRYRLTAIGVSADLSVIDERYIFEGIKFLVFFLTTLPISLLLLIPLAIYLLVGDADERLTIVERNFRCPDDSPSPKAVVDDEHTMLFKNLAGPDRYYKEGKLYVSGYPDPLTFESFDHIFWQKVVEQPMDLNEGEKANFGDPNLSPGGEKIIFLKIQK